MAAGLGFKTFTTGEVLTAADVNGYLMQGVLVFANAAARTSAITAPQEGQYSFLKDTNALEYYDGAAWVGAPVGDITAVTAGTGISGGGSSGAVTITNDMATTITASGDIVVGTGSGTYDNLPIGSTGQILTADTTVSPYKVKWAAPAAASFVGCRLYRSSAQTIANATTTSLEFNAEVFDTDAFHDNSVNPSRITIPAGKGGKYLFGAQWTWAGNTTSYRAVYFTKNGVQDKEAYSTIDPSVYSGRANYLLTDIMNLSAADYIEIKVFQNSGGNLAIDGGNYSNGATLFYCIYLGA